MYSIFCKIVNQINYISIMLELGCSDELPEYNLMNSQGLKVSQWCLDERDQRLKIDLKKAHRITGK